MTVVLMLIIIAGAGWSAVTGSPVPAAVGFLAALAIFALSGKQNEEEKFPS